MTIDGNLVEVNGDAAGAGIEASVNVNISA